MGGVAVMLLSGLKDGEGFHEEGDPEERRDEG